MTGRSLLVLLLDDDLPGHVHEAIAARAEPPARIHVVAPALVGPLDWLATAEDGAHRQAEVRAFETEWTLSGDADVEGGAGDGDPVQAVEDALREFPADEILIAGRSVDADLERALRRFGLPVTRLAGAPSSRRAWPVRGLRGLAAGHANATPFVLFFGVNAALFVLAILLSLVVLLVLWVAGYL